MKKGRNEQLISEMEEVIKQLRQAQEETSAAAALTADSLVFHNEKSEASAPAKKKFRLRSLFRFGRRLRVALLVVLIAALGAGWYFTSAKQSVVTASMFVTGVKEMSALATAEAYVMTTIEGSDNKLFGHDISVDFPGTKRNYLFVVPAKMVAGVDLKNLTEHDVHVDQAAKTVTLTLPHATFLEEAVQNDKVKVFTDDGLLHGTTTAKEGFDIVSQKAVNDKLVEEAKNSGVLETAERNAEKALQALYGKMGYDVKVTYE